MNLMTHNSESNDFMSRDNKVFWEVNFKDALLQCSGNTSKKAWKYFCRKTSCVPDSNKESNKRNNNLTSLDDYDYCEDVKGWKTRVAQNATSQNNSSWKIPGCEEFYKQDMFQNPFAYIAQKDESSDEKEEENTVPKSRSKTEHKTKTKNKNASVSGKKLKSRVTEDQSVKMNPKTISNKANNKTAKIMN